MVISHSDKGNKANYKVNKTQYTFPRKQNHESNVTGGRKENSPLNRSHNAAKLSYKMKYLGSTALNKLQLCTLD
jgi:hypothetical protein